MFAPDDIRAIVAKAESGYWGPLARAVTIVENSPPWDVTVPTSASRAHIVGVTGPPGAGKSTLTGRLIAVGVNVVEPTNCSLAHAEMVALANAHQALGQFDLGAPGISQLELVTSCEPCAMCYGAIIWSGVRKVTCGARGSDATAIGFDEAPKPRNWVAALKRRGISTVQDLCRNEAVAVFRQYRLAGGGIYNPRQEPG